MTANQATDAKTLFGMFGAGPLLAVFLASWAQSERLLPSKVSLTFLSAQTFD